MNIGSRQIGEQQPVYIVAEMSGNHNHSLERAERILIAAKDAGADAIKLQTYTPDTLTLDTNQPWFEVPTTSLWAGQTLHQLYSQACTPWEWHPKLQARAAELGLDFFSSPFDASAVNFLESLHVPAYKIASP